MTKTTSDFASWRNDIIDIENESIISNGLINVLEADSIETEKIEFLLSNKDVGFSARGNIHAIVSQMKQGKTYGALTMCAAAISGKFGSITAVRPLRVLVFDTEQGAADVKARKQSVIDAAGGFSDNIRYIMARQCVSSANPLEISNLQEWRAWYLELCITEFSPDIVILDGLRDLCADINDTKEATRVITYVQRLAADYDCAIYCILHQNKDGKNIRGHIGTELQNKCADYFETQKKITPEGDVFFTISMSQLCSRHKAAPPWRIKASEKNWGFSFSDDLIDAVEEMKTGAKRGRKYDNTPKELIDEISLHINIRKKFTKEDLKHAVREILSSKDEKVDSTSVNNHIMKYERQSIIAKDDNGMYSINDAYIIDDDDDIL